MSEVCIKCGTPLVAGGVRVDKTVGCFNCTNGYIKAGWLQFNLYGRWDELEEICTPKLLKEVLEDVHGSTANEPPTVATMFEGLSKSYVPIGLSGTYTVAGIDTAANSYPSYDEVALDKQGVPLTLSIGPHASAFDILQAVVAISNVAFDGFPHHCYPEGLDIDPVAKVLYFSMGS